VSCGNPHETPCSQVISDVYLYLDAECDEVGRERIKRHLDECSPCLRDYGIEQEVKALVARCCGHETAPDGLRERLRVKLREVVAVGVSDGPATATSIEITQVEIITE